MDYEQKMILRTLYIFVILALIGSILILVLSLVLPEQSGLFTSGLAAVIASLVMLGLVATRQLTIPRLFMPLVIYGLTTYLLTSGENQGVHDEAMGLYSMMVALAGMLMGRKGVLVYGLLGFVTIMWMGYAELAGWVTYGMSKYTTILTLVALGVVQSLVMVVLYLLVDVMRSSIDHIRANENKLAEANQLLEDARAGLEVRVEERTRRAEDAVRAADDARFALEAQIWQITGQAQLGEALRLKQNLAEFANTVISFLCHYMDFSVGALYVFDGKKLKFSGGYGIESTQIRDFELGEGVLGQAVAEKRMLILDEIPPMRIVSALVSRPPETVIVVPLFDNEQAVGAMELGSLKPVEPREIQFLSRVEESIAMSIHAAQIRAELDRLLQETQRQAEELQAQEEELRAANEELIAQSENMRANKPR